MTLFMNKDQFEEKYPLGEVIGNGTYSNIYKVKNQELVVKIGSIKSIMVEIDISSRLDNKIHILRIRR